MKRVVFIYFCFYLFLFSHKINVFPYKEGNKIYVESYFSDGKPVKNSKIEIYDEKGEKIIEGKTDEKGIFSFDIPDSKKIKIVLKGDEGHKTETIMELQKEVKKEEGKVKSLTTSEEEIKKFIEEIFEREMNEFLKEYKKDREKQRISDIIGGIGYILGIFGIYLYFRKK